MTERSMCSPEKPCTAVQLMNQRLDIHEEEVKEMKAAIEALKNRLPLWATMAFTACGSVVGFLSSK